MAGGVGSPPTTTLPSASRWRARIAKKPMRRTAVRDLVGWIPVTDSQGTFVRDQSDLDDDLGLGAGRVIGRAAAEFVYPEIWKQTRSECGCARAQTCAIETQAVTSKATSSRWAWSRVVLLKRSEVLFSRSTKYREQAGSRESCGIWRIDQLTALPKRTSLPNDITDM